MTVQRSSTMQMSMADDAYSSEIELGFKKQLAQSFDVSVDKVDLQVEDDGDPTLLTLTYTVSIPASQASATDDPVVGSSSEVACTSDEFKSTNR
jgi:hypothetical protein